MASTRINCPSGAKRLLALNNRDHGLHISRSGEIGWRRRCNQPGHTYGTPAPQQGNPGRPCMSAEPQQQCPLGCISSITAIAFLRPAPDRPSPEGAALSRHGGIVQPKPWPVRAARKNATSHSPLIRPPFRCEIAGRPHRVVRALAALPRPVPTPSPRSSLPVFVPCCVLSIRSSVA